MAAGRRVERRGHLALDRLEGALLDRDARHLRQQRLGVGMVGRGEQLRVGAVSTTRPRYMMTMRSEMCWTTPRSWLMKR